MDFLANGMSLRTVPHVTASLHGDGVVWLNLNSGKVFSANRVGALIWSGVLERRSADQVAESISREFPISREAARADAAEFLAQLSAEGLLVASSN